MTGDTATTVRTTPQLIQTIKAHLAKAAQALDKSGQHETSAGLYLKELKARKPSALPWPEYVRATFNLGQSRADELIRIADGRTDVETVRAGGAAREAKSKARLKASVTDAGSSEAVQDDGDDEVYEDTPAGRRRKARHAKQRKEAQDALFKTIAAGRKLSEQETAGWRERGIMPAWDAVSACGMLLYEHRPDYGAAVAAPPCEDVLKFCKLPMRFVQDFSHRFIRWMSVHPNLKESDREALISSLQSCADEMSRLAQSLRSDEDRADEADDPDAPVTSPDVLEDNILHAIGRISDNARLFNKLLKISALDREAADRIATAIDRAIGKLRSIKSTLEKKDCGAELVPAVKQAHAAPP